MSAGYRLFDPLLPDAQARARRSASSPRPKRPLIDESIPFPPERPLADAGAAD